MLQKSGNLALLCLQIPKLGQQIICVIARSGWLQHVHSSLLCYIDLLSVKHALGVVFWSCVFWYGALATLWCDIKLFVIYLLCNLHAMTHEMTENEITGTIHSPPRNNRNHPEPARKQQEPCKAHQEISGTIGTIRNHAEPTTKQQQPFQSPPANNSKHPEPTRKQ